MTAGYDVSSCKAFFKSHLLATRVICNTIPAPKCSSGVGQQAETSSLPGTCEDAQLTLAPASPSQYILAANASWDVGCRR